MAALGGPAFASFRTEICRAMGREVNRILPRCSTYCRITLVTG